MVLLLTWKAHIAYLQNGGVLWDQRSDDVLQRIKPLVPFETCAGFRITLVPVVLIRVLQRNRVNANRRAIKISIKYIQLPGFNCGGLLSISSSHLLSYHLRCCAHAVRGDASKIG